MKFSALKFMQCDEQNERNQMPTVQTNAVYDSATQYSECLQLLTSRNDVQDSYVLDNGYSIE